MRELLEGLEAVRALRGGRIALQTLVPGYPAVGASPHETERAGVTALRTLSTRLIKRPRGGPARV